MTPFRRVSYKTGMLASLARHVVRPFRRLRDWYSPVAFEEQLAPILARAGVGPVDLRAALADRPAADGVRTVWSLRDDLRTALPLGLTPAQRHEYAHWLLTHGRDDFGFTPAAVAAYLYELARDRAHGLFETYRWSPEWQRAQPHALTRDGWPAFRQWVADRYDVRDPWLLRAVGPTPPRRRPRPGVNILSHYRHPSGLQAEANQIGAALELAGCPVARRDLPLGWPYDTRFPRAYQDLEEFDVSLAVIGATEPLDEQYRRAGLHPRPGVYRIAGWAWELADFPAAPVRHAGLADEIWTPSEFCAAAVRRVVTDRPVLAMPPGLHVPTARRPNRNRFGLRRDAYLFLFFFDMVSVMERKNSLGLIRAFRRAFPNEPGVQLAIKVSRGKAVPEKFAALTAAAKAAGVTVIDKVMTREESFDLMACCDAYVSLHRAEGFGLTVAEAMLMGKPVIATDYSSTAEFLTPDVGLPVKHTLVPVGPGCDPYPASSHWAEPDEAHAAERMRWAFENRAAARAVGRRAWRFMATKYAPAATARRMIARLTEIRAKK